MADRRRHRGAHPEDARLFAQDRLPVLQQATRDLSWHQQRGYADKSALKLVGDRYALESRQRFAIVRAACAATVSKQRLAKQLAPTRLGGQTLWIDGFNVLTTVEVALSGGVVLHAQDGCYRDVASMHGSYRKVRETSKAIQMIGESIAEFGVDSCHWLLDRPVSNSGRLKAAITEIAADQGWDWRVELDADPDTTLVQDGRLVASADRFVLDRAERWFNLARFVIAASVADAWILDLAATD